MKKFQKIVAVGAAFAMAMSMGVSAFAEVEVVEHQLGENETTYSTLDIADYPITLGEADTQYTVVLIPAAAENATLTDADILYLNQGEKGELFWASMGTKAGTLTAGDYILRVGCEDGSIQEAKITVKAFEADGPEPIIVQLGDTNDDGGVDASDINPIIQHILDASALEGKLFVAGDTNADTGIDASDINPIIQHILEAQLLGTATYTLAE